MATVSAWYVVHTQPHGELKAQRHLMRQGFEVFLPQYVKRRRHARKIELVRAPLFPRYLFVAIDMAVARWRAISSTIGVNYLVCSGNTPLPVPNGIVESIRGRVGEDGLVPVEPTIPFKMGDPVQMVSGALADSHGLFQCVTDEDRVIVLLDLMGRQLRVKVPLEAVAAIA
ncbi:MAG: transcriptional activator RfaH [Proteobacteria bacterium]|nr:transcriptional activator RfaH [Pseudomonadota bacterium]